MKKVLAIVLALILVLSVATVAFAAATKTKVTTQKGLTLQAGTYSPFSTSSSHTYKAVKILDLYTLTGGNTSGTVYQYGIALSDAAGFQAALTSAGFSYDSETGEIQKNGAAIASNTTNGADCDATRLATAIAQYVVSNNISGTTVSVDASTNLECGYYLVYEASNSNNDGEVATKPILVDIRPTDTNGKTVALKDAAVALDKSVNVDGTPSGETVAAGQASVLNYTIATNFPTYGVLPSGRTVSFVITDVMPAGIDITESTINVAVGSTSSVSASSSTYTKSYNSTTRTLTITFVSSYILAHPGESVVVTYDAKPNTSAVYNNAAGNPNTVSVTFANNPVVSSETDTLTDDAKVYLYDVALNKLDGAGNALAGATFQMHTGSPSGTLVNFIKSGDNYYAKLTTGPAAGTISGTSVTDITVPSTGVTFYGLPAGDYYLVETAAPSGYAALANAVHIKVEEVKSSGNLTGACKITVENAVVHTSATGTTGSGNATSGTNGSVLHVKVQNYRGVTLPATGSTMSLILMIGGGVVVLGGLLALFFVSKKKKEDEDEATTVEE